MEREVTPVGREIVALTGKDGLLHAETVVDWAQAHPQSALHAEFDWDDKSAARTQRIETARRLIAIHVVTPSGQRQTVSLMRERTEGGGYRNLEDVMSSAELRREALAQALNEVSRWCDRHDHFPELRPIARAVSRVIAAMKGDGEQAA